MITILIHIVTMNVIIIVSVLCHFQIIKILQLLKLDLFSSKLDVWKIRNERKCFVVGWTISYSHVNSHLSKVENSE